MTFMLLNECLTQWEKIHHRVYTVFTFLTFHGSSLSRSDGLFHSLAVANVNAMRTSVSTEPLTSLTILLSICWQVRTSSTQRFGQERPMVLNTSASAKTQRQSWGDIARYEHVCLYFICMHKYIIYVIICVIIDVIICVIIYVIIYVCVCVFMCDSMSNVYVCMSVCLYVWMDGCMHAWMYVCAYVCMHACMHGWMYVRMYACMRVCMYACMHACMHAWMDGWMDGCMYDYVSMIM